jgi:hypothetical protein
MTTDVYVLYTKHVAEFKWKRGLSDDLINNPWRRAENSILCVCVCVCVCVCIGCNCKSSLYPLHWKLGETQSRSGRRGEEKILDPTGIRTPTPQPSGP